MPSLTREIPNDSDLAKRIRGECRARVRASERDLGTRYQKWTEAEDKALAFIPEREADRLRKTSRDGGMPQYTTIQIPYSYAVLMAAHTYLTSVFMGRSPVLQYSGRHGESQQQVQAVEALIDYQVLVGRCMVPMYIWLYDFLKYGIGITCMYWEDRMENITTIQSTPMLDMFGQPIPGKTSKQQITQQGRTYSGNRVINLQPWDFLWDTRFPAWDFQRGEYCGARFTLNWNEVVRRQKQGYYTNIDLITSKSSSVMYSSSRAASSLERPEANDASGHQWDRSELNEQKHPSQVKGYEVYFELIPKEWGLGSSDYPEKWVFTVTGDFSILMGAQPLGAFHCKFPFNVLNLEPEGYGITTRGMPEILEPIQNTVDWLINSHFFNVRAALNNKFIVDPSRVVMKDVLNPLPGGVIRMKPVAYGSDPKTTMFQFQVTDVTQNHLRDLQLMFSLGEKVIGVNDQIMGSLASGGRKTATEVRTSTSFGVNRLKTISEFASCSGFDTLSQMMVQNSQQYYDQEMKFKIAGDLTMGAGQGFIQVNPEMVMGFYDFVPVDGTLPIDRYAQANLWQQIMAQMRNFPQLMAGYDMGRIFEFVAQLAGLKNITQFRIQMMPGQQLAAQSAAGNVIPMQGGGQPKIAPPSATSPQGAQLPGMGVAG